MNGPGERGPADFRGSSNQILDSWTRTRAITSAGLEVAEARQSASLGVRAVGLTQAWIDRAGEARLAKAATRQTSPDTKAAGAEGNANAKASTERASATANSKRATEPANTRPAGATARSRSKAGLEAKT